MNPTMLLSKEFELRPVTTDQVERVRLQYIELSRVEHRKMLMWLVSIFGVLGIAALLSTKPLLAVLPLIAVITAIVMYFNWLSTDKVMFSIAAEPHAPQSFSASFANGLNSHQDLREKASELIAAQGGRLHGFQCAALEEQIRKMEIACFQSRSIDERDALSAS